MILCRRPLTIYDVDLIGMLALAVVALATCFGAILPAGANATEYRQLSAQIAAAKEQLAQTAARLQQISAQTARLEQGVAARKRNAPHPGETTRFLQRAASLAELYQLELVQVVPQATRRVGGATDSRNTNSRKEQTEEMPDLAGGYLISDVTFVGRGRCPDFIRFLDHLAREHPYHALQDFAIRRNPKADDERCELSWTLRLYMLDHGQAGAEEVKP